MTTKHYVTFYFPGVFMSETETREVAERAPPTSIPKGAYGYSFHSRTVMERGGETLVGAKRDASGTTYFGEVLTAEQVEALPGDHAILLSNMRINRWPSVVRTVRGGFYHLDEGDQVVEQPSGSV